MIRIVFTLSIIACLFSMSCKKKTHKVYIKNTKGYMYDDTWVNNQLVNWDVKVVINGIDYGIIREGETIGPIEYTGTKFKIDSFIPQFKCYNQIYDNFSYLRAELGAGDNYCIHRLNDDVEAKAKLIREKKWNIPYFNDEWNWEIGFGETISATEN